MDFAALKDYQTLVVGSLGFIGVAITLFVNAAIPRQQQDRLRSHEANALRRGLVAELIEARKQLQRRHRDEEDKQPYILVPKKRPPSVFAVSLPRLGLLTVDEVRTVLAAFGTIEDFTVTVGFMSHERKQPDTTSAYFWSVLEEDGDILENVTKHVVVTIDQALAELRAETGPE